MILTSKGPLGRRKRDVQEVGDELEFTDDYDDAYDYYYDSPENDENMKDEIQKRFLFNSNYWQVCKTKDASFCAGYHVPNPGDHKLTKYESSIKNVKSYRTPKGKNMSNLGGALIATCRGQ